MNILFTGASSFTGFWFVRELALSGNRVTAIFRNQLDQYSGLRRERIDKLTNVCQPVFGCDFGSDAFIDLIRNEAQWDLFCHHAADVTNYRSPQFNIAAALAGNTKNLNTVLEELQNRGCHRIVLTGSVFEQYEGAGSEELRAFSPYGLSKGFTSEVFKYQMHSRGMKLGKFVIPNPFGPYEEPRFTSYLMQNWMQGKKPAVNTPAYVRDNIHVSLLAKAYAYFAFKLFPGAGVEKFNPSGYVESQGAFTSRLALQMAERLGIPCHFELANQTQFPEPQIRINTDLLNGLPLNWSEEQAWDDFAEYYQQQYKKSCAC